jgi:hypothetical protein
MQLRVIGGVLLNTIKSIDNQKTELIHALHILILLEKTLLLQYSNRETRKFNKNNCK